jgi:DNA-binding response OmpR family regulator
MADAPIEALSEMQWSIMQRAIVDYLVRCYPRSVTREQIIDHVYPYGRGPEWEVGCVDVTMTFIRRKLKGSGWTVSKSKGGRGCRAALRLERAA